MRVDELQSLHEEFHVPDPAQAGLDVPSPSDAAREVPDGLCAGGSRSTRATSIGIAGATSCRAKRTRGTSLPSRRSPATGRALRRACCSQSAGRLGVISKEGAELVDELSRGAVRPEPQVDAIGVSRRRVIRKLGPEPFHHRGRGLPRPPARRPGGLPKPEEVDVGAVVQLAAPELAEGQDAEARDGVSLPRSARSCG